MTEDRATRFTGVVVTLDEERHLSDCLASLAFCDELLVIDLGSRDRCVEIARAAGARVEHHERVPIVEPLREKAARMARNDWIVFADPDEVQPDGLGDALRELIAADPRLGLVGVPSQFYFAGRRLTCTAWGLRQPKFYVCHRERVRFSTAVHVGLETLPGHTKTVVPEPLELAHFWMDSWDQLRRKHERYLTVEGEAMHRRGTRFGWGRMAYRVLASLKRNLLNNRGLVGGWTGVRLSLFHARYTAGCWLSLRRYERPTGDLGG